MTPTIAFLLDLIMRWMTVQVLAVYMRLLLLLLVFSFASCLSSLSLPCIVWLVYPLPPCVRVCRRYLLSLFLPVVSCLDTCQQALGDDFGSAYVDNIITKQCCWLLLF
jgi:hypothetical protein